MNHINFLPARFVQQQARQNWVFREALWIGVTLVLIVGWFVTARGGLPELREYKESLSHEAEAAKKQKDEVVRLQRERQEIFDSQKLQRKLIDSIQSSSVLTAISKLMPDAIVLRDFDLNGSRPTPKPKRVNAEGAESEQLAEQEKTPEPIRIAMTGIAASDAEVANFVGKLSSHGIFSNVKMVYSRAASGESAQNREFRIEMEVPLDRVYVAADDSKKEVANAH